MGNEKLVERLRAIGEDEMYHHPASTKATIEEAAEALSAAERAGVVLEQGWQLIEDGAPKDGTPIMLGFDYSGRFVRYIGHWCAGLEVWGRDEVTSAVFPKHMQGWFTHWRPLPAPPASQETSSNG